ncbi:MAG: hypothetical protein SV422_07255 [Pseudomonadota bacterium]|nr:hypothetical protein [Pseudomonadota bacterium]
MFVPMVCCADASGGINANASNSRNDGKEKRGRTGATFCIFFGILFGAFCERFFDASRKSNWIYRLVPLRDTQRECIKCANARDKNFSASHLYVVQPGAGTCTAESFNESAARAKTSTDGAHGKPLRVADSFRAHMDRAVEITTIAATFLQKNPAAQVTRNNPSPNGTVSACVIAGVAATT